MSDTYSTVLMKGDIDDGWTVLHYACANNHASYGIISKLIEIGGEDLITRKNINGETALQHACANNVSRSDIVSTKLITIGGRGMIMEGLHYRLHVNIMLLMTLSQS